MTSFAQAIKNSVANRPARTANGMAARASTANAVLDFFGAVGSARQVDISPKFVAALAENEDQALRVLLWARDIRQGAGERSTFRKLLATLEAGNPGLAGRLISKIPELGRWDDLFVYADPLNKIRVTDFIKSALLEKHDALCAKWMPRKGATAVHLTKALGLTPKQYRKLLVGLTQVVETDMCARKWESINFSHVPSVASARYQKAFGRNAPVKYSAYIAELKKPQSERSPGVKINAGAVYPHDVVKSVALGNEAVADEQWKALPNYIGDAHILPMVDVSGSMGNLRYPNRLGNVQPIEVAVALGLYVSDKNTGPFKDVFLTFSTNPTFVTVKGTLSQKMQQMSTAHWQMTTNLHGAFDAILTLAIRNRVSEQDMPKTLLILSDMQFNSCARYDDTAMQMIRRAYHNAGYEMPKIVFWNLNAGYNNVPVKFDEQGTAHISGFSPSVMKAVLANDLEDYTPYNVMLKTIMSDRYAY